MSDKGITIGKYQLDELKLISYKNKEIDLLGIYQTIQIHEDIFANTLSGHIVLIDSFNLAETLPIIGQEKLKMRFLSATHEPSKTSIINYTFDVYKIGVKQIITEGAQGYLLHFYSPEMQWNLKKKLSRFYKGQAEAIVENI